MKKALVVSFVFSAFVAIGCNPDSATTSANGVKPGTTIPTKLAPTVPATLQNDAYHYYGLGRAKTSSYLFTMAPAAPEAGTESVVFKGLDGSKAKFDITRTGGLVNMGELEQVVLDEKGVTVVATSPGTLEGNPLALPASLAPGTTWETKYKVTLKGQGIIKPDAKGEMAAADKVSEDHSKFKVIGPEQVKTKAGTFDALLIESEGDESLDDGSGPKKFKLKTQSWYVKDMGAVKIVLTSTLGDRKQTITIEATPGEADKP